MATLVLFICLLLGSVNATLDKFMFIGLDGFGGYYMRNFTDQIPNIQRLMDNGYYTFEQRNQIPAVSAPNWSTLLTGMPPSDTGIHDNDWTLKNAQQSTITTIGLPPITGVGKVPPSFWDLSEHPRTTAAVYSWDWFSNLIRPGSISPGKDVSCDEGDDDCVARTVLEWIDSGSFPDYSFVYFGSIDEAGHAHGWGSPEYYTAARAVDQHIGKILDGLSDSLPNVLDSLLIATTADHGGFGRDHGGFDQVNMETPVIYTNFAGLIKKGHIDEIHSNVRFLPTCLNALHLDIPYYMATPLDILVMATRDIPGWMYSEEPKGVSVAPSNPSECPLIHLLPRLKQYLSIVDPDRLDKAMELLVNCQSEDELFADLQAQYGDLNVRDVEQLEHHEGVVPVEHLDHKKSRTVKSDLKEVAAVPPNAVKSSFIVDDDEDEEDEADESDYDEDEDEEDEEDEEDDEEDEEDDENGIEEPDPDEDRSIKKPRRSSPVGNIPVTGPIGPLTVCQYGRACYRKNPKHFQEFAHPWRIDTP